MSISYKTKYTNLLAQHLQVIGHLNAALTALERASSEVIRLNDENERLSEQVRKLQAAAVKSIEAKPGQKEAPKSK